MKQTVLQVAEYSSAEKERSARTMRLFFALGIAALIVNAALNASGMEETPFTAFFRGATFALALLAMVFGLLFTTGAMMKIQAFKRRLLHRKKK